MRSWSVPKEWNGETAAILGGGPSFTLAQLEMVRAKGFRRIAVNQAFMIDPTADVLCWGDQHWWFKNRTKIRDQWKGKYAVTWKYVSDFPGVDVCLLKHTKRRKQPDLGPAIADAPTHIFGTSSGQGAINLAVHFGVRRIVLLGFDMTAANGHNWHEMHERHATEDRYRTVFIPELEAAAILLKARGVEVLNCSPVSTLTCFPKVSLEEVV